jgi:RNA polymerase sigma-70 factor (ECF subfamily)
MADEGPPLTPDAEIESLIVRGYRYALALTHDRARAEDLVQDAWLAILRRDGPRHVGYLFRTIRNRFFDLERRRHLIAVEPLDGLELSDGADFDDRVLELRDLEQALGRLRKAERETLYLAAVEGYTIREIASLTQRPIGSVSSLIQRARQKMRRFLVAEPRRASR